MTATPEHGNETRYPATKVERKWQDRWDKDGLYQVSDDDPRPKWYELTMYPYPSGDLHIGHWYTLAGADAHARLVRMKGYNVMHPMGFDSFGLPAENAAIKGGVHPYESTMANIDKMRKQLRSMGTIYDWNREIVTSDPEYYKWNQWLFLKLYEKGLAYRAFAPANWCPTDNTVLANEQVEDGRCERCDTEVERRELNQWFFRITEYADELLEHSDKDWPERVDTMQTNWIGRSEGVDIQFDISEYGLDEKILTTFTTRIDTVFGVTFLVMAPEHPLVNQLTTEENREPVEAYLDQARKQSEIERLSTEKVKTGVPTGAYATNRLNGERVPILVGDYVLLTYGTGIVMGVPAHDSRDFQFAMKYGLPVKVVIAPDNWNGESLEEAYLEPGTQVNSGQFDGMDSKTGWHAIASFIEANDWGSRTVQYRMRDWLISRQRYWGTPIPIIYCDDCGTVPVQESDLPVTLPKDAEFRPTGESPLKLNKAFVNTTCPKCSQPATRETDTMDTFVDSSWYQFRYANPHYKDGPVDPVTMNIWGAVDQYTGGAEHAVMHLLYARFFTKAMRDLGLLAVNEPFKRLFNQGHILSQGEKMSKSRGNVVAPDQFVESLGADAVRCYLMFIGPWDQGGDWNNEGAKGMSRWLNRVWEIGQRDSSILNSNTTNTDLDREMVRATHKTIKRVITDLERFKFNTGIAALMELTNSMNKYWDSQAVASTTWDDTVKILLTLLSPMAPHITEELWERQGHTYSIHNERIPQYDDHLAAADVITLVVQVNGRLRDTIEVEATLNEKEATEIALTSENVMRFIEEQEIVKVIYVPGKLVNIVAK